SEIKRYPKKGGLKDRLFDPYGGLPTRVFASKLVVGLPELRFWAAGAISHSKYCGYVLCGHGRRGGDPPLGYNWDPPPRRAICPNLLPLIGLRGVCMLQVDTDAIL